ncbi:MAG: retroviral-like aspartic protease family protein, partial [Acidobacteria bacterium]|nr:retroviral-like aspartic protease family protein [Acidobacteriota bacterium]
FKEVRGKIIVQARVNGAEWTDFVVDTGAERTAISRRGAQRFGVTPLVSTLSAGVGDIGIRGLELGTIESLEVGSLTIRNLPCLIKNPPLTDLPTREAEAFSPLAIGLSMRVDYKQHLLTIGTGLSELPADFELPLNLSRLATVRGIVDNARPVNFVVDTGGEVISISAATARALNKPADVRRIPLKVYGTSGWDREAYLLQGVDLAFDAIRFRNLPVVVLNLEAPSVLLGYQLGGIVGHVFLSKYRVDLDLDRSVMRLKVL